MFENIILGAVQGIVEWLPVSSEAVLVLIVRHFFDSGAAIEAVIKQALLLHLGTFLAALVYFRKDVRLLIEALFNYKSAGSETQKIFKFLIIATLLSGFLGVILLKIFVGLDAGLSLSTKAITLAIGLLLLITGALQIRIREEGYKKAGALKIKDGLLLGFVQGLSVLPGLSRSGLTVSTFLLRGFDKFYALKLSFLMSLPIVLGGNIIFNFQRLMFSPEMALGLVFSFIFGILTIDLLLKLAKKINFGYFVLFFGILVIVSIFI